MWKLLFLAIAVWIASSSAAVCSGRWSNASSICSSSCDGGTLTEIYVTSIDETANDCPGEGETRTLNCNTFSCDCVGEWTDGECSASCDIGSQLQVYSYTRGICAHQEGDTRTNVCNTEPCADVTTCEQNVTFSDCQIKDANLTIISDAGSYQCMPGECLEVCCVPAVVIVPVLANDASFDEALNADGSRVTHTKVYQSTTGRGFVCFVNVSEPLPPLTLDNATFDGFDFGEGVESLKLTIEPVDIATAAARLNITLPAGMEWAPVISIQRYDKNGNPKNEVPMYWHQSSDITANLTVYIVQQALTPPLVNLVDFEFNGKKGSVKPLIPKPANLGTGTWWFKCWTPRTSSFVGASPVSCGSAAINCGYHGYGSPIVDFNTTLCNGLCNITQCCIKEPECGNGYVNYQLGEQCEPPNVGCCNRECKFKPKNTVCRRQLRPCERQSVCTGFSGKCPNRAIIPDGTPCDAGFSSVDQLDKYYCLHGHCRKSRWCGNGKVERNEDCDPPNSECCDSQCRFKPTSVICRQANGPCDVAEFCSGKHSLCGLNFTKPNGATCFNGTSGVIGMCHNGVCGDAQDYHSHSSSSSSSSHHH